MARIPTAQETIRQPAPASPGSQFRGGVVDASPIARGLASISQGAERISAQIKQEEDEAKRFKTAADFERFKGEQLRQLTQASRDAEPGAFGLTENALKTFKQNADNFFNELPEEQKAQYNAKLIGFENQFLGAADDVEYKARTTFYRDEIGSQAENLRTRIIDGDISFDEALATGRSLIAESGLSRQEKRQLERGWRKDAAAALWRNEFNNNPLNAVLALGGGTEQQRVDAQRGTLFSAMEKQESGGNPLAISPKGAAGIMQVMPATGADIAKEIGDANYPTNGSVSEQQAYLQDPEIGRQYGQYYMNKQLDAFDGDIEAALIAYNAGPANAKKWLEAGRDYSVLPKRSETEPYVRNILGGISGTTAVNQYKFGEAMVGPQDMQSQFYNWADFRNDRFQDAKVDQAAVNVLDDVTAAFGKGALRITSGFRSQDHNNKTSFSTDSRHTHGDAFDIDVSGYNDAEKEQLISLFVASGARGVGHYDNGTIHVDFRSKGGKGPGGLALWYNKNQPYTEGGKWFSEGINQGLASRGVTFARQGPTDARYDVLDYDTRQKFIAEGNRRLADLNAAASESAFESLKLQMQQNVSLVTEQDILAAPNLDSGDKQRLISFRDSQVGAVSAEVADALKLRLSLSPQSVSEDDILGNTDLDDGQKASLINTRQTELKKYNERQQGVALYAAGVQGNALSTDDRKSVDGAWEQFNIQPTDENYNLSALSMVQKRGIVPGPVLDGIRGTLAKGDIEGSVAALDLASAANDLNPQSLAGRSGSTDVRNAVAEYNYFRKLGYSQEEAAAKVINARQPGVEQPSIPRDVKKTIDGITSSDVENIYDQTTLDIFTNDPTLGPAISERTILGEYRDLVEEEYQKTGDIDVAKARANEQMKRTYNVSNATGEPVIMRYPPESYYPPINGSYEYLSEQIKSDVTTAFGEDAGKYNLVSVPGITDVDIRAGRAPRYGVIIEREDGTIDTLPEGVFFQASVERGEEAAVQQSESRYRQMQNEALENEGLALSDGTLLIGIRGEREGGGFIFGGVVNPETKEFYKRNEDTDEFEPTGKFYEGENLIQMSGRAWSPLRSPTFARMRQFQLDRESELLRGIVDSTRSEGQFTGAEDLFFEGRGR